MVTDADLEKELQATRDANSGDSHYHYMKEAWLLIALRRQSEGIELAQQAQRVWAVNRAKHPSPYGGSIYWEPWIAEAAIALAEGHWSRAEECARKVLVDFEEEGNAGILYELALQAQGRLYPNRVLRFSQDAAQDLANFDLHAYALQRARMYGATF